MSGGPARSESAPVPEFTQVLGHPRPLWMLFMTEFWERFAFYGMRWALTLYIVAQFHGGDASGEAPASRIYGAYLALVYATAIFGGYVADRIIGYQRSILLGAVIMATGLFMITVPNEQIFKLGLATIIAGNGLFKPNISTMVGKLYGVGDPRRDSGFTIFYMGINAGAFIAPILTGWLAGRVFGSEDMPTYKVVFFTTGIGMLISLVWFWIGRRQLGTVGRPQEGGAQNRARVLYVGLCALVAIPVIFFLLTMDAGILAWVLGALFIGLCAMIMIEGVREGAVARDRAIAMLIIFVFNIMFWMFFEQAGSSFNFLAEKIVNRDFGGWIFPVAWFQSINPIGILALAPVFAWLWVKLGKRKSFDTAQVRPRPHCQRARLPAADVLAVEAGERDGHDPVLDACSRCIVIQTVGELCLSPIGLSMVTKLAPVRLVGLGMGGWFLSTGIGNNLSGIFASGVSGEGGMTTASALSGYTFGFWALVSAGAVLLLIAPLIQRLMHGVK